MLVLSILVRDEFTEREYHIRKILATIEARKIHFHAMVRCHSTKREKNAQERIVSHF